MQRGCDTVGLQRERRVGERGKEGGASELEGEREGQAREREGGRRAGG